MLVAIWGINAYNIPYTAQDWAILTVLCIFVSIGTAGVPGTATVAAATVFAAAGLPLEFIAVTLPISTIADMARTATNVTAAAVSATVVARQVDLLDDEIFDGNASLDEDEDPVGGLLPDGEEHYDSPLEAPHLRHHATAITEETADADTSSTQPPSVSTPV